MSDDHLLSWSALAALVAPHHLTLMGGFLCDSDDDLPKGCKSLVMLGPREPSFWPHLQTQPEWQDGRADPIDRWSRRVIGHLACDAGAKALFPFGGPPYRPFYAFALRTKAAWQSPVQFLVHHTAGLFVAYRGALALPYEIDLPPLRENPCISCAAPCQNACPVGALSPQGYDVARCHGFLDTEDGKECMKGGCIARRACPVGRSYGRMAEHSAYYMGQFHHDKKIDSNTSRKIELE